MTEGVRRGRRDGGTVVLPATLADAAAREADLNLARLAAVASDAVTVMLRSEAWPSVTASARVSRTVVHRGRVREILRVPDGQPTCLRDIRPAIGPETEAAGAMFDVLPPRRPTPLPSGRSPGHCCGR